MILDDDDIGREIEVSEIFGQMWHNVVKIIIINFGQCI